MNQTCKIVVTIWVLFSVCLLALLDALFGGMRFASSRANIVAGVAICCLPLVCVVLFGFLPRTRARQWGFFGLVPLAALCLLIAFITFDESVSPTKVIRVSSFLLGRSRISAYYDSRQFGGGVYVQQEVNLLPGLLWVKPIADQQGPSVKISVLDRHHVRCDYTVYSEDASDTDTVSTSEAKRDVVWVF